MGDWRNNWTCFSPARESPETDAIVQVFYKEGVRQNWWTAYGSSRSILANMGLNAGKPQIFHGTKYVGESLVEVQTYIYTLKRIHGEPV